MYVESREQVAGQFTQQGNIVWGDVKVTVKEI